MAASKKIPLKTPKASAKDTIYIDIDDEITSIIEKVHSSESKIVALVLPKRTTTLKSIVNMRLLKRTTDNLKKNLVLITSEASLLPIAGAVRVHVAKTLQSQPSIPPAPEMGSAAGTLSDEVLDNNDEELDSSKPIGELAGLPTSEDDESIEVGDAAAAAGATLAADSADNGKKSRSKKLKVPNFDKFRLRLLLVVGAIILLFVGLVLANGKLLKAQVIIKTDSTTTNSDVTLQVDPAAPKVDTGKLVIPAQILKIESNDSATTPATGQKDKGHKASGTVTLTLTDCSQPQVTIYAGTAVSTGGLTYLTQSTVVLKSVPIIGDCNPPGDSSFYSKDVGVIAQAGGTKYNLDASKTFTVAGASNVSGSNAAAISGGTTNIVKVIDQSDIDAVRQSLIDKISNSSKDNLIKKATDQSLLPLPDSFSSKDGSLTYSAKVGDEAASVKLSGTIVFSMTVVSKDDLDKIVKADAEKHIDTSKQAITDTGLNNATFKVSNKKPTGALTLEVQTVVTTGAHLDTQFVKNTVGGKKKGEAQQALTGMAGVKEVTINLSPFWVTKIPKDPSKITVKFEEVSNNAAGQ